jgi:hypothetical protein
MVSQDAYFNMFNYVYTFFWKGKFLLQMLLHAQFCTYSLDTPCRKYKLGWIVQLQLHPLLISSDTLGDLCRFSDFCFQIYSIL